MRNLTAMGVARNSMLQIIELSETLLPEPVEPATSR